MKPSLPCLATGALITVWLEVRVLPGTTRFSVSEELPAICGHFAGSNAGRAVSVAGRGRDSVDFGCRSLGSANPFLARPAGVAHEDRQIQIDKPSIAYWRGHSISRTSAGDTRRQHP